MEVQKDTNNIHKIETSNGLVFVEGPASREYLETLTINEGFSNFRIPERQYEALCNIASSPSGYVYVARNQQQIVGYVVFHKPNDFSRWSKHPRVLELGAIEISNQYRRIGLGTHLLKAAFSNPDMENHIIITTEFTWHWDLKESGLDVWNYQRMLTKLFSTVQFKRRRTDDPEILEHPANMLMVRIGSKIPQIYVKNFEEMLYQQTLVE